MFHCTVGSNVVVDTHWSSRDFHVFLCLMIEDGDSTRNRDYKLSAAI